MQSLASASVQLLNQLLSSVFTFDDGDIYRRDADVALSETEPDENHPLSHFYFGA